MQWRVPVPLGTEIDFELVDGALGEFADGTTVEVDFVLDQASSKIVEFNVQPSSDDEWFGAESLGLLAADGGWRVAVQDRTRIQLIWEGADAPDELTLVAGYPLWLPVEDPVTVFTAGGE